MPVAIQNTELCREDLRRKDSLKRKRFSYLRSIAIDGPIHDISQQAADTICKELEPGIRATNEDEH